jgi:hypothetical protein
MRHRGHETVTIGHGDLRCPSRPGRVSHLRRLSVSKVSSGCLDGVQSHFGASMGGTCLRHWSVGLKLSSSAPPLVTPGYPTCRLFLCFLCNYNVHILISTYVNVQRFGVTGLGLDMRCIPGEGHPL